MGEAALEIQRESSDAGTVDPQVAESKVRCADVVVEALIRAGVDTFIGVPGGAISPIYDALIGREDARLVHARHETTAVFMAIGFSRLRPGSVPCVLTTSGPGVTNAVTGIATAYGEGVPLLVISGEVAKSRFGRGALQEGSGEGIDVVGMLRSITKDSVPMTLPGRTPFQIAAAVAEARSGRGGPVFLSLPLDVAISEIHARFADVAPDAPRAPVTPLIRTAAESLLSARRPLILAGSGARGASAEVQLLAARLACPVITSPKAKGIVPEDSSHCLGVFGYGGNLSALEWLREDTPDVVLAVGCGLNEVSTNSWSPLVQATEAFVQIDIDPAQFGRNYRCDLALHGDAQATLELLLDAVGEPPRSLTGFRSTCFEEDPAPPGALLAPAEVLRATQEEMPPDTVYTADIGEHLLFAIHYLRVQRPDQFIASLALGSMGSGIGAAVGAKLAAPSRPVVAVCGDFGWQMFGMDLNTCVQERLGVVFLVMNDHRMRMVEAGNKRVYGQVQAMDGPPIDFAVAARAHGADGVTATTLGELRAALRDRRPEVPMVVDVRIDPAGSFPLNARAGAISNFSPGE